MKTIRYFRYIAQYSVPICKYVIYDCKTHKIIETNRSRNTIRKRVRSLNKAGAEYRELLIDD